eukprot:3231546-Alexandrium_andersonii.AAC.1
MHSKVAAEHFRGKQSLQQRGRNSETERMGDGQCLSRHCHQMHPASNATAFGATTIAARAVP